MTVKMVTMKRIMRLVTVLLLAVSCGKDNPPAYVAEEDVDLLSPEGMARVFSRLPIGKEHLGEVFQAVSSSSENGYDEEYMLKDLLESPGRGVGDPPTKASAGAPIPLRSLLADYLSRNYATKSSGVESLLDALSESGMQIYWPFSEDWDGESWPIVTFDPGYGLESNYGFALSVDSDGVHRADSVYVDESVARRRPVWVINGNDDSAFTPLELFLQDTPTKAAAPAQRRLLLRSFTMLRNYDTWFQGGSEFMIKIGSVDGFTATTEAELKLYTASVTDMMIVVKRKNLDKEMPYDAVLMTDFSNRLDKLAFLVTEDDGGTQTTWECEATVKWQSKSYGFAVKIPYNEKDDIVWRGRLSAAFFQEADEVVGRFGDVMIKFALE